VEGDDLVEAPAHVDDSLALDLDVGRLAWNPAETWWDQDLRVGQRHPLARRAAGQQQGAHLIAIPTQMVCTSGLMNCIVS